VPSKPGTGISPLGQKLPERLEQSSLLFAISGRAVRASTRRLRAISGNYEIASVIENSISRSGFYLYLEWVSDTALTNKKLTQPAYTGSVKTDSGLP
jgi:hypothetical protein